MHKTPGMLALEQTHQRPIEQLLLNLLNQYSYEETSRRLGIAKSTITWWCAHLGIEHQWILKAESLSEPPAGAQGPTPTAEAKAD